jgi:hypothetical protein
LFFVFCVGGVNPHRSLAMTVGILILGKIFYVT